MDRFREATNAELVHEMNECSDDLDVYLQLRSQPNDVIFNSVIY